MGDDEDDDLYEFEFSDDTCPHLKNKLREEINTHVNQFLSNGGSIRQCLPNERGRTHAERKFEEHRFNGKI